MVIRLFCFMIATGVVFAQSHRVPRFADYPVTEVYSGTPAPPKFKVRDETDIYQTRFVEAVKARAARGADFSGHYAIARWSCGLGCSSMAVVDVRTGQIFEDAPYSTLDTTWDPVKGHEGLSYQPNSRLLIVEGCFDNDLNYANHRAYDCARAYYEWNGLRFKLLRRYPLRHPKR